MLEGEKIKEPKVDNKDFKGWYTDKKYTNKYNFNNEVTKDLVLYGQTKEIKEYTVTYVDNEKIVKTEKVKENGSLTAPEVSKEGHTFKYWSEEPNGKEYDLNTKVTKDITLYSVYDINKYTVTFINGKEKYDEQQVEYGGNIKVPTSPLKEYYTATNNDDLSLTIKAPLVVEKTVVTYKIEYINVLGNNEYSILTAYVVFTLNPNFKVETNYPQASSNQSSTTDEPCEYFYINDNNVQSDTISLDKQALLANDRRFVISKLNSQDPNNSDYVKDNVYIQVSGYNNESTKVYVNNSRENIVKENTFYSFDTRFGFSSSEEQDSVRFTVYLKIEGQYFEIGYYLAQISNNLSNVWSVNKYNFNATSPNDSNNPEQIYLGSDDKINKTVRLNIKISSSIADTSKRYYLGIKELFGISVNQSSYSYIANNATSTVDIYLGAIDFDKLQSQPFNEDITSGFSIYDENGEEINDESIKNAVKYQIISLQTRIELKYHNVVSFIFKTLSPDFVFVEFFTLSI